MWGAVQLALFGSFHLNIRYLMFVMETHQAGTCVRESLVFLS